MSLMLVTTIGCASDPAPVAAPTSPAETETRLDPEPAMVASAPAEPSADMVVQAEATLAELLVRMDEQLELSPAVRERVRQILTEQFAAMEPHLTTIAAEPTRSAKIRVARAQRDQLRAIRSRTETELRELLDQAQYARYEEIRQELRAAMRAQFG